MQIPATIQYFLALISLFLAFRQVSRACGNPWAPIGAISRSRRQLQEIYQSLQEVEEILGAGLVPPADRWGRLKALAQPWGGLLHDSLQELRSSGAALMPTLRRFKALAGEHQKVLAEASARSSQAMAQAIGCGFLVPVFGAVLYTLLPGVEAYPWTWGLLCGGAVGSAGMGAVWLLAMVEQARWAGLPRARRGWVLAAQCAGERFLALVRSGTPADIAWARCGELLQREAPGLALEWGSGFWTSVPETSSALDSNPSSRILIEAGVGIRKAVQLSLMEGRPCAERVEAVLLGVTQDIRARTETELSLLGTRALKPLFIFVAPALFLLLASGMYISFLSLAGPGGGF